MNPITHRLGSILITGASGNVGEQLVAALLQRDIRPIVQIRKTSDRRRLDPLNLETRVVDLRMPTEIASLCDGIDTVLHTVGWVNWQRGKTTQFTGINTFAAVDLYRRARDAKVKRFVHVSIATAVGAVPRSGRGSLEKEPPALSEDADYNLDQVRIPYLQSKRAAEIELLREAATGGPELVIVNPSLVLAPTRDGTDLERMRKLVDRFVFPQFRNWLNLVDVRDLAEGILAAAERGQPGSRYLLCGDNVTLQELILIVCRLAGKMPHLITPHPTLMRMSANLSLLWGQLFNRSVIRFYPELLKLLRYDYVYSITRAHRELGYSTRPLSTTLDNLAHSSFTGSLVRPD